MDRGTAVVHALRRRDRLAQTAAAFAAGLFTMATGRGERHPVVLAPGDAAPDFELVGSDGRSYRLADFRGREAVVIAWFPKAFTGGCAAECASIGRNRPNLRRFQAKVFGASVDAPATNRRFAEALGLDYPILSDPDGTAARAYGVLGSSGFPSRWTFYIGLEGRILEIDKHVQSASHGEAVAARLDELGIPRQAETPPITS